MRAPGVHKLQKVSHCLPLTAMILFDKRHSPRLQMDKVIELESSQVVESSMPWEHGMDNINDLPDRAGARRNDKCGFWAYATVVSA